MVRVKLEVHIVITTAGLHKDYKHEKHINLYKPNIDDGIWATSSNTSHY